MVKNILTVVLLMIIVGCSGENKVKISGVITEQSNKNEKFFVVKDKESGKVYRFDKKSEKDIANKVGHSIKMKGKILNSSEKKQVATVSICTKCHHSFKIQ